MSRLMMAVFRNSPQLLTDRTQWVLHKCDNKQCVNPDHLYIGTWVENNMDTALRNPSVTKQFMESSARIFGKKYNIRRWRKVKNVNDVLNKIKKGLIDVKE